MSFERKFYALTPVPATQLASGEAVIDRYAGNQSNVGTSVSQTLVLSYFTATRTETITQVRFASGSTAAGATPSLVRIGVYTEDPSTRNITLVASTANDTTLLAATTTVYTKAFSASFVKAAGQRYAVGYLVVTAAAVPNLLGANASSTTTTDWGLAPRLAATVSSQADLPASVVNASLTTSSRMPQFLLLP